MPEIVLPCSCCGDLIIYTGEQAVRQCAACGTSNARPVAVEASADILRHAVRQRLGCDFANAERSYQHVLLEHPDESEALWGRLLCHYGVEYVKDPATGRLTPTVHTVRRKPLRLQPEFRDACAFAPDEVRARYEQEAAYIDDAQATIRMAAASCPPYDVFLCHKTTHPGTGEKTEDFHRATQLYYYLREQGLRPFFAPESLTGLAGADYEAGVYHAIDTAKVMLVLCSDKDWLTSAWVRSEWSRFIERIDDGADKRIVPLLYDRFDPALLPPEFRFRRIQGFPMGELTSTEKLMALVREAVGMAETAVKGKPTPVETAPTVETKLAPGEEDPTAENTLPAAKPAQLMQEKVAAQADEPENTKPAPAWKEPSKMPTTPSGRKNRIPAAIRSAQVGDFIRLGEQLRKDGKKVSVQWLVLAREDERLLVISQNAIASWCYNIADVTTDWAHCSLRQWLNGEFFHTTFSNAEQQIIPESPILADMNPFYDVDPGCQVHDRVFLLSSIEARRYFATNSARSCMNPGATGIWASLGLATNCEWWLRTPGERQDRAALVMRDGSIRDRGIGVHNTAAVRPALWITLEE